MSSVDPVVADGAVPDDLWETLLQHIDEGKVIPVIGQELLTIEQGGEAVSLYEVVARRLAALLPVSYPTPTPRAPLSWVACRYLEAGREPEQIYGQINRIVRDLGPLTPSPWLRKLASIRPLRLFISTSFDGMLADALALERPGEPRNVVVYSPSDPADLPRSPERTLPTQVFQLLGRVSSTPDYAVTEEDALEFVHHLLFEARPEQLFSKIQRHDLLILGCSFPTWIVRFFIRASRENRLLLARGKMDLVVDSGVRDDGTLVSFFQSYKTRTQVLDTISASNFVDSLHQRWTALHPPGAPAAPTADARSVFVRKGVVFLSYASENRDTAEHIRQRLDAAGLEVWFDRHDIEPGEDFTRKIQLTIRASSLFIPVLSRESLRRNRRFLQIEWRAAEAEAARALRTSRFIIPIAIDDVPLDHPDFPDVFQTIHAAHLVNGALPDATVTSIAEAFRQFQEREGGDR